MWRGYEKSLLYYAMCICDEWLQRGYKDFVRDKVMKELVTYCSLSTGKEIDRVVDWYDYSYGRNRDNEIVLSHSCTLEYPRWLGDEKLHASHRSNLLRKNPEWYSKFGWKEPNNLPYVWVKEEK